MEVTCPEIVPRLGEFLVGALEPADDAIVLAHLQDCGRCAQELGTLGSIQRGLRAAARPRRASPRPRVALAAAAIAAAILLATVFGLSHSRGARLRSGTIASGPSVLVAGDVLPASEPLRALAAATVDLAGGHRFEPHENARFTITDDALSMAAGSADVHAAQDRTLALTTPLGVIEGKDASFRVSIEESTMNRPLLAASGLVLTVAVIGGAVVFTDQGGPTRVAAPDDLVVRQAVPETLAASRPPHADPAELRSLREEVAALTRERDAMQAKLADQGRSISALEETNRKLSGALDPLGAKRPNEEVELTTPIKNQQKTAKELADLLGLDDGRQTQFDNVYQDIQKKIRDIEARKAKVTVAGDTTTIEIPRFEEEGQKLTKEWNDWLGVNLAPDERRRYERHQMFENLFHSGIGTMDKTVTIKPQGKEWTVEVSSRREGEEFGLSGTSNDLESLVGPYRHLLGNR